MRIEYGNGTGRRDEVAGSDGREGFVVLFKILENILNSKSRNLLGFETERIEFIAGSSA